MVGVVELSQSDTYVPLSTNERLCDKLTLTESVRTGSLQNIAADLGDLKVRTVPIKDGRLQGEP